MGEPGQLARGAVHLELGTRASDHDGEVEGLGHVIVGASLQTFDHVVAGLERSGQDHRELGSGPLASHPLQHLETVHARQKHLEHHQIGIVRLDPPQRLDAVARRLHREAVPLETPLQQLALVGVAVDDEDPRSFAARRLGLRPVRRLGHRGGGSGGGGERRRAGILAAAQLSIDQVEQALGGVANPLEVRRQILLAAVLELLLEELAVADDLADGRAHLVLEATHRLLRLAVGFVSSTHAESIRAPGYGELRRRSRNARTRSDKN